VPSFDERTWRVPGHSAVVLGTHEGRPHTKKEWK
jgi:hypothetical protein